MAGSKGKCIHVGTSYKFEHLTHLLVVEDGASFLILCQLWTCAELMGLNHAPASKISVHQRLPSHIFSPSFSLQALKDSKVVEIVEEKVRRREEPEKWPHFLVPSSGLFPDRFLQLLSNCPEFVPRQHYQKRDQGKVPCWHVDASLLLSSGQQSCLGLASRGGLEGMRTSPFYPSESAPGSHVTVTPVPTKTEEVSNLKALPKATNPAASLTWILRPGLK